MDVRKSQSCWVHFATFLVFALLGCRQADGPGNQGPSEELKKSDSVKMNSNPPVPIDQIEMLVLQNCSIKIEDWQRVYSYRWSGANKQFSSRELSFIFKKGSYSDLRPSRKWGDIRDAVAIDDRPGIKVIFGHLDLKTSQVFIDSGKCELP